MSSKRRDRRGRGIRGPLSWPNRWTDEPMPVPRPPLRGELFEQAVSESVRFLQHHSDVMTGLVVGVEEVPPP
ncbi:MAG TPA: hypothetical protein IAA98_01965, partial [Candidatus Avipropionibacterium avicola]|nr:hypothetical protein [Candidatus Avipropionibacterium avicola]